MIGLGTMAKLAKGTMGLDELQELLEGLGLKAEMEQVARGNEQPAFRQLAYEASAPGSHVTLWTGHTKTGERLAALFVLVPRPDVQKESLKGT